MPRCAPLALVLLAACATGDEAVRPTGAGAGEARLRPPPGGAVVVPQPDGPALRQAWLRAFGKAEGSVQDAPAPGTPWTFAGLAPGDYLLSAVDDANQWSQAVVRVEDGPVTASLEPSGQGRLRLVVDGPVPQGTRNARLVVKAFAQAPGGRSFDFGEPGFSRAAHERRSQHNVSSGRWGLLVLARDDETGTLGAVAWVPDVHVPYHGEVTVHVDVPALRRVRIASDAGTPGLAGRFSLRFGEDLLPGRLLIDVEDREATTMEWLLPTSGCAVVEGRARRGEPGRETPVIAGPEPLEVAAGPGR